MEGGKKNGKITKGRPEVVLSVDYDDKNLILWHEFSNALDKGGMNFLHAWCVLT